MAASGQVLLHVLEEARRLGFVGPGDLTAQLDHSRRFADALFDGWVELAPMVADLGAGGGLPSLPMALARPDLRLVLVDASARRAAFLVWATVELGLTDRVEVWCGRAEEFGHHSDRRARFDGVVARGFGPPAATLECAAPLLVPGGRAIISEPPGGRNWPVEGLAVLGLRQEPTLDGFARFDRVGELERQYPRPAPEPRRKPLFDL